ncbi:hypothetical protein IF1G_05113 [Cordyceps javanica]|uniref:Uncharacterized protein n=1 Tax=Cordyceps javanica TaxID=43265 RepID=A0A545V490_9HYPO|nr:hypothetical protein IF1G_05113 [Cordyceps javanica]
MQVEKEPVQRYNCTNRARKGLGDKPWGMARKTGRLWWVGEALRPFRNKPDVLTLNLADVNTLPLWYCRFDLQEG